MVVRLITVWLISAALVAAPFVSLDGSRSCCDAVDGRGSSACCAVERPVDEAPDGCCSGAPAQSERDSDDSHESPKDPCREGGCTCPLSCCTIVKTLLTTSEADATPSFEPMPMNAAAPADVRACDVHRSLLRPPQA